MTMIIRLLATACFVCAQVKVEHPVGSIRVKYLNAKLWEIKAVNLTMRDVGYVWIININGQWSSNIFRVTNLKKPRYIYVCLNMNINLQSKAIHHISN